MIFIFGLKFFKHKYSICFLISSNLYLCVVKAITISLLFFLLNSTVSLKSENPNWVDAVPDFLVV
ncbi:hypothetical protein AMV222 [Betaentomopoxvirus amoorei]|uniref:AMV222 n=1 Tax=Amsacta moorei entomopoxvirus TaxID=28321 RepID=Q9EMI4_AMEPV|nr:hypothetical protein AMV222 [Amsacta moorei entomopoxvirus]AAG02928.1 AMV222 [Amsacta moorei entomopoxvirus]